MPLGSQIRNMGLVALLMALSRWRELLRQSGPATGATGWSDQDGKRLNA